MKTFNRAVGAMLLAAGCGWSASAQATTFIVDTLAPGLPDADTSDGICRTAGGECSLYAALEQANALPLLGDAIRIEFEASLSGDVEPALSTHLMFTSPLGNTAINDYLGQGAFFHVNAQRPVTIDFGNRVGAVQRNDAGYAMFYIESDDVVIENFQNDAMREASGAAGYADAAGIVGAESAIVIGGARVTIRNGLTSDPGTIAMESCVSLVDGARDVRLENYYCRSSVRFGLYVDERASVSNIVLDRFETEGGQGYGDIWIEFGTAEAKTVVDGLRIIDSEFRSLRGQGLEYTIGIREHSIVNDLVVSGSRFIGADTWGIGLYPTSVVNRLTVEDSTIDGTAYFVVDRSGETQSGFTIRNNLFQSVFGDILQLTHSPYVNALIEGNRFIKGRQSGNVAGVRLGTANFGSNNVVRDNVFDQQDSSETNRFAIWVESNPGAGIDTGWTITDNHVANIFGSAYGPISLFNSGNTRVSGNTFGEGTRGAEAGNAAPESGSAFFVANNSGNTNGRIQTWRPLRAVFSGATLAVTVAPVDPPVGGNTAPANPVAIDVYLTATDKAETYLGRIPGLHSSQTTFTFTTDAVAGGVRTQVTDAQGRSSQYSATQALVQGLDGSGDDDGDGLPNGAECLIDLFGAPLLCADSDGDGLPDYRDADDDNDGIPTRTECPDGSPCTSSDLDLLPNHLDTDSDGDGIPDAIECPNGGPCVDTDGDGAPDYIDRDSDGDNVPDAVECPTQACRDSDGDGTVDYRDADDDNDGLSSARECPNGPICPDQNLDGTPDYLDAAYPGRLEARATGGGSLGLWMLLLLGGAALLRHRAALLARAGALGLFAASGAQAVQAAEPDWTSRLYGGVTAGGLFTDFDAGDLNAALQSRGYDLERIETDDERLGYGAWLGFGLNSRLGLELAYITGADERVRFAGTVGGDLQGALDAASPHLVGYGDSYLLRLRYHHALNERWFLSPRAGLGLTQTRQSFRSGGQTARLEEDTFTWALGGGLHYALGRDWSAGVAIDYYRSDSDAAYTVVGGVVEWRFPRALPGERYTLPPLAPEPVRVVPLAPSTDTGG